MVKELSEPALNMSESDATFKIPRLSPSPSPSPTTFVDTFSARLKSHLPEREREHRYQSWWQQDYHPKPRPQSPTLPWHREYSQLDPKCGRVLVIDFLRADESQNRKRKVMAQELDCLDSLRQLYKHPRRAKDGNLRLLHVQNAPWATKFLLRKFNIDGRDELVGSNFGRYVRSNKPDRRGGKLFPNAKTWRVQHDPWRGISKTSFGFEYLKEYDVVDPTSEGRIFDEKMMELNGYDDEENPAYGSDVYIQRLACYIQHKEDPPTPPFDGANGISNPYRVRRRGGDGGEEAKSNKHYLPQLSTLDNEDAIIIFDNSQSGSFEDCLIPARSEWETHWRRLPFYLAYEARELGGNDDLLGRQCARMILDDVFRALIARWEVLLNACHTHVSLLEDKIYEQPADETRAPELWRNSCLWLQLEKLTTAHMAVVREMRARLRELVADITQPSSVSHPNGNGNGSGSGNGDTAGLVHEDDWLEQIPGDLDRIALTVNEDLVKPTQALISLLYQSVSIRDSRLSLQVDTSMWRLSWITFIFLPLTFMVGFFGMNVDTFSDNPSIKWYFIVAVPFMFLILAGWYVMKHILARQRQTPYQRGTYESFFHDLAVKYPRLWSRVGPRDYIIPRTRMDKWKWWLIQRWTRPERTIKAGQSNADTAAPSSLSRWSKIKMALIKYWSDKLTTFGSQIDVELLDLDDGSDVEQGSAGSLAEGLFGATELLTVPGQPVASAALERLEEQKQQQQRQQQQQQQQQQRLPAKSTAAEKTDYELSTDETSNLRVGSSSVEPRWPDLYSAASASPRGRPGRPISSGGGSNWSRNSSVLVEEEDPRWISQLAKQGKGWYWRPASQSPAGRSSGAAGTAGSGGGGGGGGAGAGAGAAAGGDVDALRRSSGSGAGGSRPTGIRTSIDERVGGARPSGGGSPPRPFPSPKPSPPLNSGGGTSTTDEATRSSGPNPSPLGATITNTTSLDSQDDPSQAQAEAQAEADLVPDPDPDIDIDTETQSTPRPHPQQQPHFPENDPHDANSSSAPPPAQRLGLGLDLDLNLDLGHSATTTSTNNSSSSAPSSSDEAVRAAEETAGRGRSGDGEGEGER